MTTKTSSHKSPNLPFSTSRNYLKQNGTTTTTMAGFMKNNDNQDDEETPSQLLQELQFVSTFNSNSPQFSNRIPSKKRFFLAKRVDSQGLATGSIEQSDKTSDKTEQTKNNPVKLPQLQINSSRDQKYSVREINNTNNGSNLFEVNNSLDSPICPINTNNKQAYPPSEIPQNQLQPKEEAELEDPKQLSRNKSTQQLSQIKQNLKNPSSISFRQNIFDSDNNILLSSQGNGLKQDKKGNLISRSLVGRPEWFSMRETMYGNIDSTEKKNGLFQSQDKQQQQQSNRKNSVSSISVYKNNQQSLPSQLQGLQQQQKSKKPLIVQVQKHQLMDQLDIVRQRLQNNKEEDAINLKQLKISDKMSTTRDERIFNQHAENELSWRHFIQKQSNKLHRDLRYSMLVRQEEYRNTREAAEVLNICKSESEMFGSRLWEMTLRRYKSKSRNPNKFEVEESREARDLVVTADLPDAFQNSSLAGAERNKLELIRKPFITDPILATMGRSTWKKGECVMLDQTIEESTSGLGEKDIGSVMGAGRQQGKSKFIQERNFFMIDKDISSGIVRRKNKDEEVEEGGVGVNSQYESVKNKCSNSTDNFHTKSTDSRNNKSLNPNTSATVGQLDYHLNSSLNHNNNMNNMSFQSSSSFTSVSQPFNSFRASQYYSGKVKEIQDQLKPYKAIYENNVQYQQLAVVGESQFEKEAEMVLKADESAKFFKGVLEKEPIVANENLF